MARLIELLFLGYVLYFIYRRIAAPLTRGYYEREQELREEQFLRNVHVKQQPPKIDRTHAQDADFKDLS